MSSKHSTRYVVIVSFLSGAIGAFLVMLVTLNAFVSQNPNILSQLPSSVGAYLQQLQPVTATVNGTNVTLTQEALVIAAVKRSQPAVVSIIITADVPKVQQYFNDQFNPFDLFGSPFQYSVPQQNGETQKREIGGGSGFLVSADGLVLTNKHVVDQDNAEYTVFTNDGKKHTASVVDRDPANDLAILKIDGTGYPYLRFSDAKKIQIGQTVIAIGNSLGEFRNTVSVGVVSGLARSITAGDSRGQSELLEGVIQTDAAINPGNSGGPLLDLQGNVIGINVAIVQGSQNIGFALPADVAQSAVSSVQKSGTIERPYLGVRYIPITEQVKQENNLTVDYGALIIPGTGNQAAVIPGSGADKAGLAEGDIILEVDGVKIDADHSLSNLIHNKNVGDTVTLKILRKGGEKTVPATLTAIPTS